LAWWRELADLRPQRLWISHLRLHFVEALATVTHHRPLSPLSAPLLRLLAVQESATPATLARELGLQPQVLHRWLAELATTGLACNNQGRWSLTVAGQQAVQTGEQSSTSCERRRFAFVDRGDENLESHYLRVAPSGTGIPVSGTFDPALLPASVQKSDDWKVRNRFPLDVSDILLPLGDPPDPNRVVLDHGEQVAVALVEPESPSAAGRHLVGFVVKIPGWSLQRQAPFLELGGEFEEVFPHLPQGLPAALWTEAWRTWCLPRGLPRAEVEDCQTDFQGHELHVLAPARLVERLKAANSDAIKGEAWLLAGTGSTRAAARIDLHAQAPTGQPS
jgi:hypothetical protein